MAKLLIVGCGKLGTKLAKTLVAGGHSVTGLKRHPPCLAEPGLTYIAADITVAEQLATIPTDFEQVIFILAPDGRDASSYEAVYGQGLTNLLARFAATNRQQVPWLFVSSTSVYAQTHGEWVDETSAAVPDAPTSLAIRTAEQQLTALNPQHCVVRFSGIYGPGREYLLKRAQQSPRIQYQPPYYTNRIHEQDCIAVLAFLITQREAGQALEQCYLASDDDPASQWEVMCWLAEQLNSPAPISQSAEPDADQNKRCSNQRLKALGYVFQYPSYREGYSALLKKQAT